MEFHVRYSKAVNLVRHFPSGRWLRVRSIFIVSVLIRRFKEQTTIATLIAKRIQLIFFKTVY